MPFVSRDPCVGFAFCQQQFFSVRLSELQDCIGPLERKVVREARACVNPLFKNKKRLHHVFFWSGLTVVFHLCAGRTLRVHPVCLLQHQLSQLLVERGQVLGSCGTDAGKDRARASRGTAEGLLG